jgi:DNA invertase Pin-like site-specific DNA recombinase
MILAYARVSTVEQAAQDRTSMADQEQRCKGAAMMRGAVSDMTFYRDPGVSGSVPLNRRPAGAQMLKDAAPGDIIVSAKLDRMFRSSEDALRTVRELHERKIGVILTDISPDPIAENGVGKMFFSVLAAMAEFERWRIAERMSDGRRGKKEKGGHAGGSAPFGYRIVGHGREAALVPDEDEQQAVQLMKRMKDDGRSYFSIMTALSERGFRSRKGTQLGPAQILRIVRRVPQHQAAE